jgi:hypothetical protein
MQAPKDVHVVMSADGSFKITCKKCQVELLRAWDEGAWAGQLLWYRCPTCRGVSFSMRQNLERDAALAGQMGGVFEYEIYFIKDLPANMPPPKSLG